MRHLIAFSSLVGGTAAQSAEPVASGALSQVQAACAATSGELAQIEGIIVAHDQANFGDMRTLRVTDQETGGFLLIHYDVGSEDMARARAACLGAQIAAIAKEVGDKRKGAQWHTVVFTQSAFRNSKTPGEATRWPVFVQADGQFYPRSANSIGWTIPHEQIHAYQDQNGFNLPRWLAEGHAVWVELKLANRFDPDVTSRQIEARAQRARESEGPLKLLSWGDRQPKREAFYRQVGAEERAKMDADPTYYPSGVFTFIEEDFDAEYVANDQARYLAAYSIIQGLEDRHGASAVHAWIADLVRSHSAPISSEVLDLSLQSHFRETLDELLGSAA